jgi:hemerythrin-like metal-binding protein
MIIQYVMPSEFYLGLQEIDLQHKIIYSLYSHFIESDIVQDNTHSLYETFNAMKNYFIVHCGFEEEMMEKYRYGSRGKHMIEHLQLIEIFNIFTARINQDVSDKKLLSDISEFLFDWFQHHVTITDREFVQYLDSEVIRYP